MKKQKKTSPPGKLKIMKSLSDLMKKKDFHSITIAEISKNAQVTEGLIYKYFKDKKDLLYQVLNGHFQIFHDHLLQKIEPIDSSIAKLEAIIKTTLKSYAINRVFAKILLLEVRNSPNYFKSDAYNMVKIYARTILEIITQGIEEGEIKQNIDPYAMRQVMIGSIEHACLSEVIFGRNLNTQKVSNNICNIIFNGARL